MNRPHTRPGAYRVDTRRQITIEGPFHRAPSHRRIVVIVLLALGALVPLAGYYISR